ncbi:MAG: LTA synthase family protein [Niameybacter sp.]|uniref:LTA synthase family protein n=3 Tax=Niameybacter sp. TaxID=2033640 RepID=UPI002FCB77DE
MKRENGKIESRIKGIRETAKQMCSGTGWMMVFSLLILFCGEALLRQDVFGLFEWAYNYPTSFIINLILIFSLLMVFSMLFNKVGTGVLIVGGIYMTLCVISFYKFIISGEYLVPADLALAGEAASISKEMDITIERQVVIGVLVCLTIIISGFKCKWIEFRKGYRLAGSILCATLFFTTAVIGAKVCPREQGATSPKPSLTVNEKYNENGFIVGFTQEIIDLLVEEPEGYSKEKVESLLAPYTLGGSEEMDIKPNIIMIMSESFFDVTKLTEVTFSQDPLSFFRSCQNQLGKGNLSTAIYGGRTSQTEYEVLTGQSVYFTDPSNIAYNEFVHEDTPSLAKLLKAEGYQTMALHGYEKKFFSRDKAYPNLGLDTFIASEDFVAPDLARGYISDNTLVDHVVQLYEDKGEQPLFYHIVTMQNHMPYSDTYKTNGITVSGSDLSREQQDILETYANGLKDSDKALEKLVNYFSQVKEPTIIVMYGDHLPALDEQYSLYKDCHYIKGNFDAIDCSKLYETPLMVWNNYGLPSHDFGTIDTTYLSSQLLNYIGYHKDPYMNYLLDASKVLRGYGEYFDIDGTGQVQSPKARSAQEKEMLKNLWLIQYNRLGVE